MITTRAFFAHPASMLENDIWDSCIDIRDFIAAKQGIDPELFDHTMPCVHPIRVVSGREDFQKNAHGDWNTWQANVVTRQDFMTGKPVYDLFVTVGERCGKATAAILMMALIEKKPVFKWEDGSLTRVGNVLLCDPEDWASGYQITSNKQLALFPEQS